MKHPAFRRGLKKRSLTAALTRLSCLAGLLAFGSPPASAIHPGIWIHATESDFAPAEMDRVVVTSLGDVKLSTASTLLADLKEHGTAVLAMTQAKDGTIYLSMGSPGKLIQAPKGDPEQLTTLCDIPDGGQIFAMGMTAKGQLIVAVSAEKSYLAELVDGQLNPLVALPDVRYVWDMILDQDQAYLATGPNGQLLKVDLTRLSPCTSTGATIASQPADSSPAPASSATDQPQPMLAMLPAGVTILLDAKQDNLLCLGRDGQGRIYLGTDTDGLVYRLTLKSDGGSVENAFVLLDANEPEIGSLLVLPDGTTYAATADADQAQGMRMNPASSASIGRPSMLVPPMALDNEQESEKEPAGENESPTSAPSPSPENPMPDHPSHLVAPGDLVAPPMEPPMGEAGGTGGGQGGNAVYRIDPQGFSSEIFRESAAIYRMLIDPAHPASLLLTTGNQGHVYRLTPEADETILLAKLQAQQAISAMALPDGRVLLGTANPAKWLQLDKGYAPSGTITSLPLDAMQASHWGKLHLTGPIPAGTKLTVQTRSGNVQDPEKAPWSDWSAAQTIEHAPKADAWQPREISVMSPPARFFQYRLTLEGTPEVSPIVRRVSLTHVMPNLRPSVPSIQATYPNVLHGGTPVSQGGEMPSGHTAMPGGALPMGAGGNPTAAQMMAAMRAAQMARGHGASPSGNGSGSPVTANDLPEAAQLLQIEWQASDPNQDQLRYRLEYQQEGSSVWLLLADDLTASSHEWNTRLVPDGRYRIRVTASDELDNLPEQALRTSRVSDPIIVDNALPTISDLRIVAGSISKNQATTITFKAASHLTPLQSAAYHLDNAKQWQVIFPDDLIFDSTNESLTVKLSPHSTAVAWSAGLHRLTIRVTDGLNQSRLEALTFEVPK